MQDFRVHVDPQTCVFFQGQTNSFEKNGSVGDSVRYAASKQELLKGARFMSRVAETGY